MKRTIIDFLKTPMGLTIAYLLCTVFASNSKPIFALSFLYLLGIALIEKSIYKALLYSYVPFLVTATGPTYTHTVIPSYNMLSRDILYAKGVQISVRFTQLTILLLCSVFYLANIFFKKKPKLISLIIFFMIAYALCVFLSSYYASSYATFSMLYSLENIGIITWYILFIIGDKKNIKHTLDTMLSIICAVIIFESGIVFIQTITSHAVGILYEQMPLPPNTTDDLPITRPIGLRGHANDLAIIYMEYFFLFLFSSIGKNNKKIKKIISISMILSIIVILLSRSRSVYLGIGLGMGYFFIKERKIFLKIFNQTKQIYKKIPPLIKIGSVIGILFFIVIIGFRIYFSLYTFTSEGSFYGRSKLMAVSIELIKQNPFFGIGTNMFIPTAYYIFPYSYIRVFATDVHNGFLLLLSQNGIFAFSCFIGLYVLYIYYIRTTPMTKKEKHSVTGNFISTGVAMMFLPYISIIPLSMLFLLKKNKSNITT